MGSGIIELRIDSGPGYRLYCKKMGSVIVLLLIGGDKKSQQADIQRAKEMAKTWQA
ncbi:MAG: type II toxin-antitoxin system RelE/ParE family toxin [Vulcanimicrobiaceae bacterium]